MLKWLLRKIVVPLSILALFGASDPAEAGPFADFFRDFRRAFTHPEQKPQRRKTRKRNTNSVSNNKASTGDSGHNVAGPPDSKNTHTAKRATLMKETKSDMQYGTPVPGKEGFVTSPYSPDSGYIDVRGFPPGSMVKDPYSGKTFLTP